MTPGCSVSVSIFCLDIMTLMMLFSLARLGLLYLQELNGVNRVIVQKLYIYFRELHTVVGIVMVQKLYILKS